MVATQVRLLPSRVARSGLEVLLDRCVSATPNDEVLALYDESFSPYLADFVDLWAERGLSGSLVFLPLSHQESLIARSRAAGGRAPVQLPHLMMAQVSQATIIVTVLSGRLETGPVRSAILQLVRSGECRLAHVPGLDDQILSLLVETPFADVDYACDLMAWALGEAGETEVISVDNAGLEHRLQLDLQGWDNEPQISSGVIAPGSWGNVPPGETFCCPAYPAVNGRICINGSIPGVALTPEQEVVLCFEGGKLVDWGCAPGSPAHEFFDQHRRRALAEEDEHWNTFAELGFGLNPAIRSLTGNSLFDEKAAHTIHIAIGDNATFGHDIRSMIHADLVTRRATVVCDGEPIVTMGEPQLDRIRQRRDQRTAVSQSVLPEYAVFLREGRVDTRNDTFRRRLARAYRVGYVTVGNAAMNRRLAMLATELRREGETEVATFVRDHPTIDGASTLDLLNVLYHYRVLAFSRT
jgi:hypothetical protein